MLRYALGRVLLMIPVMIGITAIVFGLLQIIPGDPAVVLLGQNATAEGVAQMRHALGLDQPVWVQLAHYMERLLRGDLGRSIFKEDPVSQLVFSHLPATIELALSAMVISIVIGIPLGVLAAVRRGSLADTGSMLFAQVGVSVPVFWLGIMLMLWFSVQLDWLPAIGRGAPLLSAVGAALSGRPSVLIDSIAHLILPAFTLGVLGSAVISRMTRSSVTEALRQDYIRTARAKGLVGWVVVYRHAFRNALLPVISVLGLQFGTLLGGAVVTETIFGWPGVGQLVVGAISQRDIPLVQGSVLIVALLFSLVNLGVDLLYAWVDPRVRLK